MDRITENLVAEFAKEYGLVGVSSSEQFEHFVNLSIVNAEYQESFDPADVYIGGDSNIGIDGLAIIVNGALVAEEQEVLDLLESNKHLEVSFIFTQAKTSSRFDGAEIGSFVEAVRDFFRPTPRLVRSAQLQKMAAIADFIFKNTAKMRGNPVASLSYVTTGTWIGDQNLQARLDQGRQDIDATALFSSVKVEALGATGIQRLYRQTKEAIAVEIDFPNKVTLPDIPGVAQAFIGVLPASALFRLIVDETGNIRRSVFEDNIRDFQGDTSVNEGIGTTVADPTRSKSFVVLNNGITIVCRGLQQTGTKCTLTGYQIVNGCQTSNVLFANRAEFDNDSVLIPTKLVGTQDEQLVNAIIRSTNSQNAVKPEELEAMTEFQKKLELYYRTYSGQGTQVAPGALYYERRSKQWVASSVEKTRIVTIPSQIKALASMFLDLPHRVSGYYGTVRRRLGDTIFKSDHRLCPYYTSALALYRVDSLFRNRTLDSRYKPYRWFLLMLLRRERGGATQPPLNSSKIDEYCRPIIDLLIDPDASAKAYSDLLSTAAPHIDADQNPDALKTQQMRDKLLDLVGGA